MHCVPHDACGLLTDTLAYGTPIHRHLMLYDSPHILHTLRLARAVIATNALGNEIQELNRKRRLGLRFAYRLRQMTICWPTPIQFVFHEAREDLFGLSSRSPVIVSIIVSSILA